MPAGKPGAMADIPPWGGLNLSHVVTGVLGGFVGALLQPELTVVQKAISILCGFFVAVFGTPIAASIVVKWLSLDLSSPSLEGAIGFLLGLTGREICFSALNHVRNWRAPIK